LSAYDWPGNIRELGHVLERAAVMSKDGILCKEHFDFLWSRAGKTSALPMADSKAANSGTFAPVSLPVNEQDNLKHQLMVAEKQAIMDALQKAGGNKTKTANLLNIDRSRLYSKMHRYNLL
jgi:two-component system response regulator AtoC